MKFNLTDRRARMLYGGVIGVIITVAGIATGTEAVTGVGLFIVIMSVVFV